MIGHSIGHYEILERLGEGGMGVVYKARDRQLGRFVAIKVLREELSEDSDRLRRFQQEARSASALNHPNIVTVYEIGRQDSTCYIVMEFIEGKTLQKLLAAGPLPLRTLVSIASQSADGMAKVHEAGIVHRDLKPANLMLTGDGFVKILDFGLAKLAATPDLASEGQTLTAPTRPGVAMGTAGYMSPEQAGGREVDFRTDHFSFGSILYEMATGNRAFYRPTVVETLTAILKEEPDPIANLAPQFPQPLRWIVDRCLAKDPADRYASTRDLSRDLRAIQERLPELEAGAGEDQRRRGGRFVRYGLGAAFAVTAMLLFFVDAGGVRARLTRAASDRIQSLAVLPLENLSGDPGQEYFADGLTEALIADLAQIRALRVISRTSVMQYKKARKPLKQIASELNVDAVLEAS
ncbi:MAG: protein kinase domain-containing protein, partial [Bryobacteraceae bacterium]